MSDRDAWIHFYCSIICKDGYSHYAASQADLALESLRERDKKKLFERSEGGYRDALKVK